MKYQSAGQAHLCHPPTYGQADITMVFPLFLLPLEISFPHIVSFALLLLLCGGFDVTMATLSTATPQTTPLLL